MPNSTILIVDGSGANQTIAKLPDTGRANAVLSLSVVQANEDSTVTAAMNSSLAAIASNVATMAPSAANQALQATQLLVAANLATLVATAANQATQATLANIQANMVTLVATAANQATTAAITAMNTVVQAINANTPAVKAAALGSAMPIASVGQVVNLTFNRPNNTTNYTVGSVVGSSTAANGAVLNFPAMAGASGGDVLLTGNDLRIDVGAIPTNMTSFRLHLYNATPGSALGDAGTWNLAAGDRANYLGYVDMGLPAVAGSSTLWVQTDGVPKQIRLTGPNLYAYLVTNGNMVPAANTPYTLNLRGQGV